MPGKHRVLTRAGVQPRERDAQKALRRTDITSALVLARNPKLIAPDLGTFRRLRTRHLWISANAPKVFSIA